MSHPLRIAHSILNADYAHLADHIIAMEEAGTDLFHFDVMDGHFVPNITFGPALIKSLRPHTQKPFDVHLMIAPVDPFIDAFAEAGANILTVHPEAGPHLHRTLQRIKNAGVKAGVALNPATPLESILEVLPDIDLILVMSVNPGFGGQTFIASQLDKIKRLRSRIDESGFSIALEVDGGINTTTAPLVREAGIDIAVVGTACLEGGQDNYAANIAALRG